MIKLGMDRLSEEAYLNRLRGKRIGVLSNFSAVNQNFRRVLDAVAFDLEGVTLERIIAAEHGLHGVMLSGEAARDEVDSRTGMPVFSLFGDRTAPDRAALEGLDLILFDFQDVGCRCYTYISTLYLLLESLRALRLDIPVWVLDRPNPLGGIEVEGGLGRDEFRSFVGIAPLPLRHGMTIGEIALYFNDLCGGANRVEVVPMLGWERRMYFDDCLAYWAAPSPSMYGLSVALPYPGTVLFEGCCVSEGRGSCAPYMGIGAPFIDAEKLSDEMTALSLPGVAFRPFHFQPLSYKYAGQHCKGVQQHVTDRARYRPVETGLMLLDRIARMNPNELDFNVFEEDGRRFFDLLAGGAELREALQAGTGAKTVYEAWQGEAEAFRETRERFLLY